MENIGALALLLAFCFAVYAILGSLIGKWGKRPFLTLSAERAVYSVWALVSVAAGILLYSLIKGDFRMAYVWATSNHTMPTPYKVAAWWGGQEGSLLLWSWLLSTYAAVIVFQNRRKFRDMMPYVVGVLMFTQTFFLILNAFVASPFKMIAAGRGIVDIGDGQGLNPLLQYWTMVIHPPMLYLGYVGFIAPFAFAIASLATKQPGDEWIKTTRRWTLVTWMFQTTGVLLGMGWAYAVLGWGGYWDGSGGKRFPASLDHSYRVPALRHDAGEKRKMKSGTWCWFPPPSSCASSERSSPAAASCNRCMRFGRPHREILRRLHGHQHLPDVVSDPEPPGIPEERIADGERALARIQLQC